MNLEQITVRILPDGRMDRPNAAAYLGLKPKTLAEWATIRKGPRMRRVGGRVFYHIDDLKEWVSAGA